MLSQKEINLISKALSFVPTPDIDKTAITNAVFNLGRKLKIKIFFLDVAVTTILKTVRRLCRNPTGSKLIK